LPAERYFINSDFNVNAHLSLEGQELHHLIHVMRTHEGDRIEVINGCGFLAAADVIQIGKKHASLEVHSIIETSSPENTLVLAQAIPRINRLDFIVEKGTELGMSELWLFPGILSERKSLTEHQLERLKNLTIAAMKQCGRLWLPAIKILPPIHDWHHFLYPAFFGDVSKEAPLLTSKLNDEATKKGVIFLTGPESGFEKREEENLKLLGAQGVKLHKNILRTDTASITALSLISCQMY
jgi:16S rRNA (uracil1498-N3)-methyltransferase